MNPLLPFLLFLITTLSFKSSVGNDFSKKLEKAHKKEKFLKSNAIQFNIVATFGGSEWANAKMTLATNSGSGKIEFKDGSQVIYKGNNVYYSKNIKDASGVRFDAYTIPYFFLLPYKLNDKGTVWNDFANKEKDANLYSTGKLSFTKGTGDAPDDWYILYANNKTNLLEKAAYIVTASGNIAEAEKNPHAIEYLDYIEVNGIPIASKWKFWAWVKDSGLTKQLGGAALSDFKFVKTNAHFFDAPSDYGSK
jgi:hypothetical protein